MESQPIELTVVEAVTVQNAYDSGGRLTVQTTTISKAPENYDHIPMRDDQIELWLKAHRDAWTSVDGPMNPQWTALDDLLDTYRLHADTGTPLYQTVHEADIGG